MKGWIAGAAIAAAIAGCATVESGGSFDPGVAQSFEIGVARQADVEAALGKPMSVTRNADGTAVLAYTHIVSKANGFTGRHGATGQTAVYVFDADGVLRRTSFGSPSASGKAR